MFVQEEKIFAGKVLRLHVCTMEGAEWLEEVPEDTTVEKLKERCLKHVRSGDRAGATETGLGHRERPEPGGAGAGDHRGPREPPELTVRGKGKLSREEN